MQNEDYFKERKARNDPGGLISVKEKRKYKKTQSRGFKCQTGLKHPNHYNWFRFVMYLLTDITK